MNVALRQILVLKMQTARILSVLTHAAAKKVLSVTDLSVMSIYVPSATRRQLVTVLSAHVPKLVPARAFHVILRPPRPL